MNKRFLNPFEQDIPEAIEDCFEDGTISICEFNPQGTMLASGCLDGRCLIFDLDTRGLACTLVGHRRSLTSVSWSTSSQYLLTGGKDGCCIVWDLKLRQRRCTFQFGLGIYSCHLSPDNLHFVVGFVGTHVRKLIRIDDSTVIDLNSRAEQQAESVSLSAYPKFHPNGDSIITGYNDGIIDVVAVHNGQETLVHHKIGNSSSVKQIELSNDKLRVLVNSSDRTIRLYRIVYDGDDNRIVDLFLEHKFQDIVTKLQYTACGFSSNCDYVFGGSSLCHNIFVWDAHTGALLKILEGPKDCVVFASWHPYRPMIASVSAFGIIYVWAKTLQENWSAFAPQFKELESNLIYKELETEFDFTDDLNETGTVDSLESFVDVDTVDQTMNQLQHALLSIPVTIEDYIDF